MYPIHQIYFYILFVILLYMKSTLTDVSNVYWHDASLHCSHHKNLTKNIIVYKGLIDAHII